MTSAVLPSTVSSPAAPVRLVVLDACVLMSGLLRPWLLELGRLGCFEPVWNERIGDEWRRNAARIWDVPHEVLAQAWAQMQAGFPQACSHDIAVYEAGLRYTDPKDRHVAAAGLAARARWPVAANVAVLTRNLKDFNRSELRRQGMQLLEPDQFLCECWTQAPDAVRSALQVALDELAARDRVFPSIEVALKRDRLFRLARLMTQASDGAAA